MDHVAESPVPQEAAPTTPATPKKRGRPRIHPLPDPNAPKRKPGRPPKSPEEEKAELEAVRQKYLAMRAGRTHKIRLFDPNIVASAEAQSAFAIVCHIIRNKIAMNETHFTGQEILDLLQNMTGGSLSDLHFTRIAQAVHRISKYDTKEVKDGVDTFAYGEAPDGKTPLAKELNKPFASMRIFWPEELSTFYIANASHEDILGDHCRYLLR